MSCVAKYKGERLMNKKFTIVCALALVLAFWVGCAHQVKPEPPVITYQRSILVAADASNTFANLLLDAKKSVAQLTSSGVLTTAQKLNADVVFMQLAQKNDLLLAALQSAHDAATNGASSGPDWKPLALDIVSAVDKLSPATFGIKDPVAVQKFNTIMSSLQIGVGVLEDLVSNQASQ